MINKLNTIGLSKYENSTKSKSELLKYVQSNSEKTVSLRNDKGFMHEHYCYFSNNFGIVAYLKEDEKQSRKVSSWNVFALSEKTLLISGLKFGKNKKELYAYGKEKETGNQLEFIVSNVIDYNNYIKDKKNIKKLEKGDYYVNIAGIAQKGSVLFPIHKTKESNKFKIEHYKNQKELIDKANSGDEIAKHNLIQNLVETSNSLETRLKEEDIFTVFESYFFPENESCGTFRVLGEITKINYLTNKITNDEIIQLLIDNSDTVFNIYINKNELLGLPSVGMRFSGICSLSGNIEFKN